jgi:hypothetical protein
LRLLDISFFSIAQGNYRHINGGIRFAIDTILWVVKPGGISIDNMCRRRFFFFARLLLSIEALLSARFPYLESWLIVHLHGAHGILRAHSRSYIDHWERSGSDTYG